MAAAASVVSKGVGMESWTGTWEMDRRENWNVYLEALGIPEPAWEAASKAPDFHMYRMTDADFTLDHKIPAQSMHLHFKASLDGEWHDSPYPKPTVAHWDGDEGRDKSMPKWKTFWLEKGISFKTEIPDFMGKGLFLELDREVVSPTEIKMTVNLYKDETKESLVAGPCYTYMKKIADEGPAPIAN
mmetsp:Transcript_2067/g.3484  ORF Transcript_2067/g.3484 Transcript_2067/m.3484 type:complete len:186 (-) Transcript_2067:127-684(-)